MMSRLSQVEALRMQHNQLELELVAESIRPQPNASRVAELKKRKLRLRDKIQSLMKARFAPLLGHMGSPRLPSFKR